MSFTSSAESEQYLGLIIGQTKHTISNHNKVVKKYRVLACFAANKRAYGALIIWDIAPKIKIRPRRRAADAFPVGADEIPAELAVRWIFHGGRGAQQIKRRA